MTTILYIYDCIQSRRRNARRVSFTKELYGFTYSWRTRSGVKQRRKVGLIEEHVGVESVADSTILVPEEYRPTFDSLFDKYQDILALRVFVVVKELK